MTPGAELKNFNFLVAYKWAQYTRVLYNTWLARFVKENTLAYLACL